MTDRQENILTMWDTVDAVLTQYNETWEALVPFRAGAGRVRELRIAAIGASGRQMAKTTGATTDKKQAEAEAIAAGVQIAKNIQAWARSTGNDELYDTMNFDASELRDMRDTATADALRLIHATGNANETALTGFNVTRAGLAELLAKIVAYEGFLPRATVIVGDKKKAAADLKAIITEGQGILTDTLDNLIGNFSATAPDFAAAYRNAREIRDLGGRTGADAPPAPTQ